ncbi:MAG: site-2 protease family protein [Elusimicrobia bacterium]|nr:site-2 protease family protein [Elusimicrobiota bacterium]
MDLLIQLPVLLFSIIIHEYAHGWVAEKYGDDTARVMGRLTFNPIPHIDLVGTILLPALALLTGAPVFGWAKPVPVNPNRLKTPLKDMVWISFAGPIANFIFALVASLGLWFIKTYHFFGNELTITFFELFRLILVINIILAIFNLIPIPPLDGSKVLLGLLPARLAYEYAKIEPFGFIIILVLLASGLFWMILGPIIGFLIRLLTGGTGIF